MAEERMALHRVKRMSSRTRRTLFRSLIALVVCSSVVGAAFAFRSWRSARQIARARDDGHAAVERADWERAVRNLGVLVMRGEADAGELLAFADARARLPIASGGHIAQAAAAIRAARGRGGDSAECDARLLRLYVGHGMLAEAQEIARAMLEERPEDPEARRVLVHVLTDRGRLDEAENVLRASIADAPRDLAPRVALAQLLVRRVLERDAAGFGEQASHAKREVVEEIESWSREPEAPAGIVDIVAAAKHELGLLSRASLRATLEGPERLAHTFEEARMRASLLRNLGRGSDACAVLATLRTSLSSGCDERNEVAREELRHAFFAGLSAAGLELLECEPTAFTGSHDTCDRAVFRAAMLAVYGSREEAIVATRKIPAAHPRFGAWANRLALVLSADAAGLPRKPASVPPLDAVADAALAVAESRNHLARGDFSSARERADDARILARGAFDAADTVAIEALACEGRTLEALARAEEQVERSPSSIAAIAARVGCELRAARDRAGDVRVTRTREEIVADARRILDAAHARENEQRVAIDALIAGGLHEEAVRAFEKMTEELEVVEEGTVLLAETAVELARALDRMSIASGVRSRIASSANLTTRDREWALALLDALPLERSGDMVGATERLTQGAGSDHARIAVAGAFADRHGLAIAATLLRASLPEGARTALSSGAAAADPALALAALTALETSDDPRIATLARLYCARMHPAYCDPSDALARAAQARADGSRDAALLVAMGELLLAVGGTDVDRASALLGDAMQAAPSDAAVALLAARAALASGDLNLAAERVETVPSVDRRAWIVRIEIALASSDASRALAMLDEAPGMIRDEATMHAARALRALSFVRAGRISEVDVRALDARVLPVARMTSPITHAELVERMIAEHADTRVTAHLAADLVRRVESDTTRALARRACAEISRVRSTSGDASLDVALFRTALAAGEDATEIQSLRARILATPSDDSHTVTANDASCREAALLREECAFLLARDPLRALDCIARARALEGAADAEMHGSFGGNSERRSVDGAMLAIAASLAAGVVDTRTLSIVAEIPESPERALLEAQIARKLGQPGEAFRHARHGLALAEQRAFMAWDIREGLLKVLSGDSAEPMTDEGRMPATQTRL